MKNQTVIIAEDDRVTSDILNFNLLRRGFKTCVCHDGETAWHQLQQHGASLLITDHQMPRLSGVELCERIRRNEEYRELPLMLCSGKGFELDHQYLKEQLRIDQVFFKPFSPREVVQAIEDLLNRIALAPLPQGQRPAGDVGEVG